MTKRLIAFCFVCATLTILSARPAHALFVSPVADTNAQFGSQFMNVEGSHCDGQILTYYLQRIKIGGHWMWIPTNQIYSTGKKDLVPQSITCSDGSIVYGAGACGCLESVAAGQYSELPQTALLDPLNTIATGAAFASRPARGEPGKDSSTAVKALAAENRRRHLLFSTVRT
jgi:hypothetical protein